MKSKLAAPHLGFIGTTRNSAYVYYMRGSQPVAAARAVLRDRKTADQLAYRAMVRTAAQTWQTLTAAQRQTWEDYIDAHAGRNESNCTALDQYMLCNIKRQILALSLITEAPATTPPATAASLTLVAGTGDDEIRFSLQHVIPPAQVGAHVILVKQTRSTQLRRGRRALKTPT